MSGIPSRANNDDDEEENDIQFIDVQSKSKKGAKFSSSNSLN